MRIDWRATAANFESEKGTLTPLSAAFVSLYLTPLPHPRLCLAATLPHTRLGSAQVELAKCHREVGYYDKPQHIHDLKYAIYEAMKDPSRGCAHGIDFSIYVRWPPVPCF